MSLISFTFERCERLYESQSMICLEGQMRTRWTELDYAVFILDKYQTFKLSTPLKRYLVKGKEMSLTYERDFALLDALDIHYQPFDKYQYITTNKIYFNTNLEFKLVSENRVVGDFNVFVKKDDSVFIGGRDYISKYKPYLETFETRLYR